MAQQFIQIGFTAARDPATGEFLEAIPLYIEETYEAKVSEMKLQEDIAKVMAAKMREYINGTRKLRKENKNESD